MWSVFFVFLSYLDRNFVKADFLSRALDVEKQSKEMISMLNGTFCAKMSALGENFFYQVSDGTELVRSVVSPDQNLVDCSITAHQMHVKSFVHECRLWRKGERAGWQLETRFAQKDEAKMMCQEFKKSSGRGGVVQKDEPNESTLQDEARKRSKRGFTYPGTVWCGLGNMADDYDQLGDFAETDSCCRIHDHCPHVIHAFSSHYGYTNLKWHSICHCDCDNALKDCLRKVNDTSSRVVGQAFFNVIGVSCFDFVYEEQCAERHWYGWCKRYEKLPIAVVKEAAPYDFGGIDVIDELTVAPPRRKDFKKSQEEGKPESATPSTLSGPKEPSLTNVVTAAEDFIKVLATVSTSQSSNTDSDKGETQSSEKKKKKNTGKKKKTTKKQKRKEMLRKRKQKSEVSVRVEVGAAVSPSGNKTKGVVALSNFIIESHKHNQSSRNMYRAEESRYDLGREEEPSNKVMKDEPAMLSVTPRVQNEPAKSDSAASSTSTRMLGGDAYKAKNRRLSKKRRRKNESQDANTTENLSGINVPAIIPITTTTQAPQKNSGSNTKKQPVLSAASKPVVTLKVKQDRSMEREDGEQRRKMRKDSSGSPIVSTGLKNSSAESVNTIPPTRAPTVAWVSHRREVCGGRSNLCVGVLKRQRMRNRRRKPALPFSDENQPLQNNSSDRENALLSPTGAALNSLADDAATSRFTENSGTLNEQRLLSTAASSVTTKQHMHTIRKQRRPRKKAEPAALSSTEELHMHRPGRSYMATTGSPAMSPVQFTSKNKGTVH
ncbi:uncharacterized protein proca1 [Betta splendens]|uniref:Uncharacterized protein proca1 n=1 Tax=Betta splendens TaxID=158456 RepID=A0A6P7PDG2_BETSP|nr:uncharacterized protein proca1 [Betta splendens]